MDGEVLSRRHRLTLASMERALNDDDNDNFGYILEKVAKLYSLESQEKFLKTRQRSYQ